MKAKLDKILKDLVSQYDGAAEEQDRANALVIIQTALVNRINWNTIEVGNINIKEMKKEIASK